MPTYCCWSSEYQSVGKPVAVRTDQDKLEQPRILYENSYETSNESANWQEWRSTFFAYLVGTKNTYRRCFEWTTTG